MLTNGQHINHYQIRSAIGEGGMGEVYLVEDTKLHRKAALKILPAEFAADVDRMERFVREARSASALNHPNIITIYEIGESNGTHFIAMEFIDGKTLNDYKKANPLDYKSALEIAIQIASALDEAHSANIVHRDIKPDNVMIRPNGLAKILDFGIAKLSAPPSTGEEDATAIKSQTQAGMIIGTANYMSPEQAAGKAVDARSDIFSFGVVLYEMLAAHLPFAGETVMEMIGAILKDEPSLIAADVPFEIKEIVEKCLQKDKQERYQSAKDLLTDLQEARDELNIQKRLKRTSSPNREEPKTQILRAPTTDETEPNNSIAVLAFENMSAAKDNEYFCDGLAEELLNALSKIEDLKVAARTSAFSFKGKNANASEIGAKLGVKNVLEGSVRKSGDKLRITVQLVDAANGFQLWSERYDRELKDIFDIQDEITLAVVNALKVKLFGDEKAAVLKRYTDNTEAYQLYLKGQFHYGKFSEAGWRKASEYFEQALALEPDYVPAYAGLAAADSALWYYGYDAGQEAIAKIRAAIAGALGRDADLAEAYRSQALLQFFVDWDFPAAEQSLARALALNPNDAPAHGWHGFWLVAMGRPEQAVAAARRALELDPLSLVSGVIAGWTLWFAQHYKESLRLAQTLLDIDPHFGEGFRLLGMSEWGLENYAAAEDALQKAVAEGAGLIASANLCGVYAHAGKQKKARQILQQIRAMRERSHAPAAVVAYCYALLGEVDETLIWMEQAFVERNGELVFWGVLPDHWISFRRDPRFIDLLRRIGLPAGEQRRTGEALETAILSTEELETKIPDTAETRNAAAAPTHEPATNPKAESRNLKSKWWLFGLLALLLTVGGFFGYKYFAPLNKQIESIAVMPFVNESGNSDVEYLSDGMTETLINSLSQIPNVNVKARSSVFRYKGKDATAQTIGKELNVQAILNGHVVQRGDGLTLSLELIDASTENVIWSESYNRKQADLVSLQSEIARDVSSKLKSKLSGADQAKISKTYTTDAEAYKLYLQGRFYWNKRGGREFSKAENYFRQAIERDPNFALGYVGLADFDEDRDRPKKKEYILRALALDDSLAEAHASLGYQYMLDYDWAASERELNRAIELNPNCPQAHGWNGARMMMLGRYDEAMAEIKRAMEIDPTAAGINFYYGVLLFISGKQDESVRQFKRLAEMEPTLPWAHSWLSQVYRMQGNYAVSVEERAVSLEINDRSDDAQAVRESFVKGGWNGYLREMIRQNEVKPDMSWSLPAIFLAQLGEKEKAVAALTKGAGEGDFWLFRIKFDPAFDGLRGDPRFQKLLKIFEPPQ